VSQAAFFPGHVSGLESDLRRGRAFDIAAQVEIGHGYDQVRAGVMVFGQDAARLQLEFGGARAVLYEQDVLGPAVQDVQASFFVPLGRRRAVGLFVLQEFDGDVAEGLIGKILRDVGKAAGKDVSFSILQGNRDWRLARDIILHVRGSQRHVDIVVAMAVHERGRVGRHFHLEYADVFIFQCEMMSGLGGNLNLRWSLGGESKSSQQNDANSQMISHEAGF